jgi:hypothetical protein
MANDFIVPNDPTFTHVYGSTRKPRLWAHFKDVIGSTDGTYIPIIVTEKDKIKYTNKKSYTTRSV